MMLYISRCAVTLAGTFVLLVTVACLPVDQPADSPTNIIAYSIVDGEMDFAAGDYEVEVLVEGYDADGLATAEIQLEYYPNLLFSMSFKASAINPIQNNEQISLKLNLYDYLAAQNSLYLLDLFPDPAFALGRWHIWVILEDGNPNHVGLMTGGSGTVYTGNGAGDNSPPVLESITLPTRLVADGRSIYPFVGIGSIHFLEESPVGYFTGSLITTTPNCSQLNIFMAGLFGLVYPVLLLDEPGVVYPGLSLAGGEHAIPGTVCEYFLDDILVDDIMGHEVLYKNPILTDIGDAANLCDVQSCAPITIEFTYF